MKFPNLFGGKKDELPKSIGIHDADESLAQHKALDTQVRELKKNVQDYLNALKTANDSSSAVTQGLRLFFQGTRAEGSMDEFQKIHEKMDSEIPGRLLGVAQDHIIEPLVKYEKELDEMKPEFKKLQEKQASVNHYTEKLQKLESKGVSMPKEEERLIRNKNKLKEVSAERNQILEEVMLRMEKMQREKLNSMKPIYKAIYQFQQEWYKQCSAALQTPVPWISSIRTNAVPAPPPMSGLNISPSSNPIMQNSQKGFDESGNPIGTANMAPSAANHAPVQNTATGIDDHHYDSFRTPDMNAHPAFPS